MRLVDLIYGEDYVNMNGIPANDDYIMAKHYYEADLDNVFFRKESSFESYQPPDDDLNIIKTKLILCSPSAIKIHFPNQKKKLKNFQCEECLC